MLKADGRQREQICKMRVLGGQNGAREVDYS